MPGPSLAELRSEGQPRAIIDRLNDEHWAGRLYMRKLSPFATWVFARLGWSPNAVTLAFIGCGIAAGVVAAFGGLAAAALLTGLGLRAQGHLTDSGPYVSAGLAAAVLAVIVKAETDNVVVARAKEGLPAAYGDEALQPTGAGLALARRLA